MQATTQRELARIFIQNPATKQFIDGKGNWVADRQVSRHFRSFERATETCQAGQIQDYHFWVQFYAPDFETILTQHDVHRLFELGFLDEFRESDIS